MPDAPRIHRPDESLPPRLCAGDALARTVQTRLAPGTFFFLILTRLASAPVGYQIGGSFAGAPPVFTPTLAIAADGTAALAVPSPTTAAFQPGRYRWQAFTQDSAGNRDQVAEGEIRIAPNPVTATPADQRTRDERILANLHALAEGKSLDDVAMYKIGTRELTKLTPAELNTQIALYEARVRNQRRRNGERVPSKTIRASFGGGYL